ncbi:hypothetical protein BSL78_23886 [Apostichopus japonicus]|uniref:Reverse transcriptase domain-containing protein n=1 Tax=Stichopus japonicus TaxID=307972 RepID=A0A2G8JU71_STIJA|nr:hypothetical protein BSL78_23886 [Apostichopus japonicus]
MKSRDSAKRNEPDLYRFWRNKVTCLIRSAKQNYFKKEISKNVGNTKEIWKILKNVQSMNHDTNNEGPSILRVDDKNITGNANIVEMFNSFFTSVARSYTDTTHSNFDSSSIERHICPKIPPDETFEIPCISENFVFKYLTTLDASKATGVDELSAKILKMSGPHIYASITRIINISIRTNTFPSRWKVAKVIPIFKSNSRQDLSNYRPISILPVLSKILEKHVHIALTSFLKKFDLLEIAQSGFRSKHSCETALLHVMELWMEAIDKGQLTGAVLLDLRKAFDLVNHDILIKKLKLYQFSSATIEWFKSYLMNRSQYVVMKGTASSCMNISNGVPQGSILGPLLFLIYINDFSLCLTHCKADMYADDTTFHISCSNVESLQSKLNFDAKNVSNWCKNNKMAINTSKTKSMLICSRQRYDNLRGQRNISVKMNDIVLENSDTEKLLGVRIDAHLTWQAQIDYICSTISTRLALLRRIKQYLDTPTCNLY